MPKQHTIATTGEKIAGVRRSKTVTTQSEDDAQRAHLALRIDRAIANAVRKERARCVMWLTVYGRREAGDIGLCDAIANGEQSL